MAVQAGKDLLVKVDMTSDGQFETIAGLFRDAGTDERARQLFFDGLTPDFQIVIPSFGIIEGPFQVAAIEYGGSLNGEATYELSLQSAGQLSFTADTADTPEGGV